MIEHLDPELLLALALDAEPRGDGEAQASARAHLARCPSCAARLQENRAMLALLDGENQLPAVPPALRARVLDRVGRASAAATAWAKLAILLALVSSAVLALRDGRGSDLRLSDLVPNLGLHCLAFQGAVAAIPLVVGMALTRAGRARLEPLAFAAWSMGFAVLGQVVLRTHCEASNLVVHLFAVHFTGVLLAGFIAAGVGRALRPATPT